VKFIPNASLKTLTNSSSVSQDLEEHALIQNKQLLYLQNTCIYTGLNKPTHLLIHDGGKARPLSGKNHFPPLYLIYLQMLNNKFVTGMGMKAFVNATLTYFNTRM
jgi:hypothetical protein